MKQKINGISSVIVANDATVKAGAYFEVSLKKGGHLFNVSVSDFIKSSDNFEGFL